MGPFVRWLHRFNIVAKILLLLSMAGFLYQVSEVSDHYFKYETLTIVQQVPVKIVEPENIVFCPRYADIVDREKLFNETGIMIGRVNSNADAYNMEGLLTVEQIFEYTPDPQSAVESCGMRDENNYLITYWGDDCRKQLKVSKFFTQEYICYLIELNDRKNMSFYDITTSSSNEYIVYEVSMSSAFAEAEYGMAVLTKHSVPTIARDYSKTFRIRNLTSGIVYSNQASMMTRYVDTVRLEAPYDTACIDVFYKEPVFCFQDCMSDRLETMDRIPAEHLTQKPFSRKPLSHRDLENWIVYEFYKQAQSDCHRKCDANACSTTYVYTTTFDSLSSADWMKLRVLTPGQHDELIVTTAGIVFFEYFSFVCGCFNLWFGVSLLSLDPTTWKDAWTQNFGSKDRMSSARGRELLSFDYFGGKSQEYRLHHIKALSADFTTSLRGTRTLPLSGIRFNVSKRGNR